MSSRRVTAFRIGDRPKRGEGLRIGASGRRGIRRVRKRFFDAYRRELQRPPASHALRLLSALASVTPISVGCFCEDETCCHRLVLRDVIAGKT